MFLQARCNSRMLPATPLAEEGETIMYPKGSPEEKSTKADELIQLCDLRLARALWTLTALRLRLAAALWRSTVPPRRCQLAASHLSAPLGRGGLATLLRP